MSGKFTRAPVTSSMSLSQRSCISSGSMLTAITFVALISFGMSQSVIGAITSTLLQMRVPQEQRGRVMSLNTLLIMGIRPLGDFPAGALISLYGAPITAAVSASIIAVAALSFLLLTPAEYRVTQATKKPAAKRR